MKLSRMAYVHRRDIEEACTFSADDQGISKYFKIHIDEVHLIRLSLAEKIEKEEVARLSEEAVGSADLKRAIESLFHNWERKHNFQQGAGAILLPAGYAPK